MKKYIIVFLFFQLLFTPLLYAEIAKVIDLKGDVEVKISDTSQWQEAQVKMYLQAQSEIKTAGGAECTLAFDEELENIFTIQGSSRIKLENIKPADIYLPVGRVFSLIEDLKKVEEFKVRTPEAVVGVRGTGDYIEANNKGTVVKCFEGKIDVAGLDKKGNVLGSKDLIKGAGININRAGRIGSIFSLSSDDYVKWKTFRKNIDSLFEKILNKVRKIKKVDKRALVFRGGKQVRRDIVAVEVYLLEGVLEAQVEVRMYAQRPKIDNVWLVGPGIGRRSYDLKEEVPLELEGEASYEIREEPGLIHFGGESKEIKKPKGTVTKELFKIKVPVEKVALGKRYQLWVDVTSKTRSGARPKKYKFDLESLPQLIHQQILKK